MYSAKSNYLAFAQKCNTKRGAIDLNLALYFDNTKAEKYEATLYLKKGDIVVNSTGNGTLGRVGFFDCEYPQGIIGIIPDSHVTPVHVITVNSIYIYHCLKYYQPYLESKGEGGTNQKELRPSIIAGLLLPIPPLSEQYRIIAKLQESEPLVERYGKSQESLDRLNVEIHQLLKKSILQEAIQGRLVPQIQSEGSAAELLQQIKQEKQRLVKEGKLKKSTLVDSVIFKGDDNKYYEQVGKEIKEITDEILFDLPKKWQWCRIGLIFMHNNGKQLNKGTSKGKLMKYITTSNLYWDGFTLDNLKMMPFEEKEIERCMAVKGDLLVCEGGYISRQFDRAQNKTKKKRNFVFVWETEENQRSSRAQRFWDFFVASQQRS